VARSKKKSALRRWSLFSGSRARGHASVLHQLPLPGAVLLLWLLGQLEPYLYLGALVGELGFHLALLSALCAAWMALRRAFVAAAALLSVAALFAAPLLPFHRTTRPTPQSGPLLRVASVHLARQPLTTDALADWLQRERPDAVALTGLRDDGLGQASFLGYRVVRSTGHDSLLLVRSALAVPQRDALRGHASMAVRAGRCQARVVALQLPALASYTMLDARARQIEAARALPNTPRSVWLGQLGSRAEAHDLQPIFAAHALRDARIGHGRLATAPAALGSFGFPLTHVLVHGWISVREVGVQPPLVPGGQRVVSALLELTEPRCRLLRGGATE
jgi:hypothetical protein